MTAEPLPRIVRLLPGRFSRDPKAPGTKENTAAALLLAFTVAAILWANSPWAETYWALLDTHVGFTFGGHTFELTVKHLINDGLMTFFFFIVGLEVTSEFTIGELTDRASAAVPVGGRDRGNGAAGRRLLAVQPVRARTRRRGEW